MVEVVGKDTTLIKQATCRNCASILKYTESETKGKTVSDYSGDTEIVRYIVCPCCHSNVTVGGY